MFEKAVNNCILAKVSLDEIADAEKRMGIKFPESLLKFYREYGYGFVNNKRHAINKLLAPGNCADIRLREGVYEEDEQLELTWDDNGMEEWSLIFFENYPGRYIAIGLGDGKIYSPGYGVLLAEEEPIADSLEEFLEEIAEPEYWIDPDFRKYAFDGDDEDEDDYDEDDYEDVDENEDEDDE